MQSCHVSNTYGCGAYASMVSTLIFGDKINSARRLKDLLKSGWRQAVSSLLAAITIAGMLPVSAFAAEETAAPQGAE